MPLPVSQDIAEEIMTELKEFIETAKQKNLYISDNWKRHDSCHGSTRWRAEEMFETVVTEFPPC